MSVGPTAFRKGHPLLVTLINVSRGHHVLNTPDQIFHGRNGGGVREFCPKIGNKPQKNKIPVAHKATARLYDGIIIS